MTASADSAVGRGRCPRGAGVEPLARSASRPTPVCAPPRAIDEQERSTDIHPIDKCKLKPCRFKPCSWTPVACSSTPTGRASARRWRGTVSIVTARRSRPRSRTRSSGSTLARRFKATNDQQRGWTYFNLVLTEAGVALYRRDRRCARGAQRLPPAVQSVGDGARRCAAGAGGAARARLPARRRLERQRHAARACSTRLGLDRGVRRRLRLASSKASKSPIRVSFSSRSSGRARAPRRRSTSATSITSTSWAPVRPASRPSCSMRGICMGIATARACRTIGEVVDLIASEAWR